MVCSCLCFNGVDTLVAVDGEINAQKYTDILDNNLRLVVTTFTITVPHLWMAMHWYMEPTWCFYMEGNGVRMLE